MEKDEDVGEGSYTTMYRSLDTRIGRWRSVDPVTRSELSPYNSMDNNPIKLTDEYGNCPFCIPAIVAAIKLAAVGGAVGATVSAGTQYATTGEVRMDKTLLGAGTGALIPLGPSGWAGAGYVATVTAGSNVLDQTLLDGKSLSEVDYSTVAMSGGFGVAGYGIGSVAAPYVQKGLSTMFSTHSRNVSTSVSISTKYGKLPSFLQGRKVSPFKWEVMKNREVWGTIGGNAIGDYSIGIYQLYMSEDDFIYPDLTPDDPLPESTIDPGLLESDGQVLKLFDEDVKKSDPLTRDVQKNGVSKESKKFREASQYRYNKSDYGSNPRNRKYR